MEIKSRGGRLAKNTLVLYIRMLFLMCVNLYTSRVILNNLGVNDLGIYEAVGSIVSSFSLISGSLSSAISRFLTFELGTGNKEKLRNTFASSVTIQLIICAVVIVIGEIAGYWFITNKMILPADKLAPALIVFQFSTATFCINLISIPYNATIIAHEKMSAFAFISIIEGCGKLLVAFLICYSNEDRLIMYGALMFILSLIIRIQYGWYCKRNFEECKFQFHLDRELTKKMFAFAGWNYIGSGAGLLQGSGVSMMLSTFFLPAINTARGLAMHATNSMLNFIGNFMTALNPQITKSYAAGEHAYMMKIIYAGTKLSFSLFAILSTPILFNTEYLIQLWLNKTPDYVVAFTQLAIVYSLVNVFSKPLITAMLATGDIRNYQIIVGGIKLLNLPIDYILLRLGNPPICVYYVAILLEIICLAARIVLLKGMINLNAKEYTLTIILRSSVYYSLIVGISFLINKIVCVSSLIGFAEYFIACIIPSIIVTWYIYCDANERQLISQKINLIKSKF